MLAFERSFRAAAKRFGVSVPAEVADAMGKAAGSGAKICLLTMLSRAAASELLGLLAGRTGALRDDVPRGFPWPDPVLTAMLKLGTWDVREVAVVSATEDGVLSGYRAGARVLVGVRGGATAEPRSAEAGATHVLDSIADASRSRRRGVERELNRGMTDLLRL